MLRLRFAKFFSCLLCVICLVVSFTSQASAALTPLNDDTEFVRQTYRDFLNREADPDGLSFWVNQLATGTLDRSEIVEEYLLSGEFQGNVAPVARLYFAYFLRLPDYDGLMYWIGLYSQGTSLGAISEAFSTSAEFQGTYGNLSNSAFVSLIYQNVLGRTPDADGLAYWAGLLNGGSISRGEVMVGFSESAEYQSIMAEEIYVTMTYIGLLRRSPEQGGFDYWVGLLENGAPGLSLIDEFLISNEYQGRFDGTWVISSLTIIGPTIIDENSSTTYSAQATWSDGRTSLVNALWSEYSGYASIDSSGTLTTFDVDIVELVTLGASFSSGGVTAADSIDVNILSSFPELAVGVSHHLSIIGYATDVYQFTAPVSSNYRISLTNTLSDLSWELVDSTLSVVASCDNSWSAADEVCYTPGTLTQGETYYLGIDEWDYVSGSYVLRIDPL